MPVIHLTTFIAAPLDRVFDLARSVDMHKFSMQGSGERIISGVFSGLMKQNDTVTWEARHLFRKRRMQVQLSSMNRPDYFSDEQVTGPFKKMKHEHYFRPVQNGTIMIDVFYYKVPWGMIGRIVNKIILHRYMKNLLSLRNEKIRQAAESNLWKQFLQQ
ncbi:MAG TPA: SRPBCC family protein [Flavisolibacter sp.]